MNREILHENETLNAISQKVLRGERINVDECVALYELGDVGFLGQLADSIRVGRHGKNTFFNRNFHIEPTNVCVFSCNFCSYSRQYKNREDGWELSIDQMMEKVKAYEGQPITEVHIVGGVHPKMDLEFFMKLLKSIKAIRPDLHIKGFTAVELDYMIRKAGVDYKTGLSMLKEAGLDSLPGGGAEIFDAEIRNQICADKCTGDEWLKIHQTAHELGMASNATMLYGHIENYRHRALHMEQLRSLQDRTKGFNTFIPLKFRNKDNDMSNIAETTMVEDLKNYAVSRIFMDNFPHIKAYWPMIGRETAAMSLSFGVDDLDGTIDDSTKIYSMAGSEEQNPTLTTEELVKLIRDAGKTPIERDTLYNTVRTFEEVSL
ncbi:MAG: aminofutalosine synthase MqnE [Bacteroidota bacterium]|jgi:aminodeoxyfutalosine synthase